MWRDEAYLLDMLLASRKILEFTHNLTWQGFRDDELTQNAVMHQIQIIGEAASKVSAQFQRGHSQIPWHGIIGMRNRLVHEYFYIIPKRIWDVVDKDIPELIQGLEPLVPPEEQDGSCQ